MKTKALLLNVLLSLVMAVPAFAESKSVSIRVSATIKPIMEVRADRMGGVSANTNLMKNQYQMTEGFRQDAGQTIKTYSLTSL